MEDLNTQIKKLHETVYTLLKRYKQLQKENDSLKTLNEEYKKHLLDKDTFIKDAEQKSAAANLVSLYNDEEKKILQQKIDGYLKDIQKCLSLLNV